jgi:hypothetical protein
MPFLPFLLLLVGQVVGRSASFALGWATALYFGQVPGKHGRVLAVISLLAAGWVLLLAGFGAPLAAGATADGLGLVPRNFDVDPLVLAALLAALLLTPPVIAGLTVWVGFHADRSARRWLRLLLPSYPATASLGVGVLQMVVLTPLLIIERLRGKRTLLQVALSMRERSDDEALTRAVERALRSLDVERVRVHRAHGFLAWPMRTVGYAVKHLLGAVVRGQPVYLAAGELQLMAYATDVAVLGPARLAHRARAALEREVPFSGAYLTWNDGSQRFEDEIMAARRSTGGSLRALRRRLDAIQQRIDAAPLGVDEWNVLSRLRLEVEHRAEGEAVERASA